MNTFLPAFSTFTFFILFLFLLLGSSSSERFSLTGVFGNSILPRTFGPESFLMSALIVCDFVTGSWVFIADSSAFSEGSSFTGAVGFSLEARSIFPRMEGPESLSALTVIFSTFFLGSSLFIEITFLSGEEKGLFVKNYAMELLLRQRSSWS